FRHGSQPVLHRPRRARRRGARHHARRDAHESTGHTRRRLRTRHLTPSFSPALELNARFYREVVGPALDGIPHASARLGTGSEVLGFDTEQSTDHGWGPHLNVFVAPDAVRAARTSIEHALPETLEGWPVRYGWAAHPVRDYVEVNTLPDWLQATLACNPLERMSTIDWLATPQQLLLGVVRGAVYHDDAGELTAVRRALAWFPTDVARWLIAC